MTHADAAADLNRRGLPVIPVNPASKVPAAREWAEQARPNVDEAELRAYYDRRPDHNIGIATGHPLPLDDAYVIVLDIDEHDPAHSGEDELRDLEAEVGPLPDTATVLTPTGGRHLYYRSRVPLTNAAASNLRPNDWPSDTPYPIDVRGVGGYVLAPPSVHPDGGRYEWDAELDLDHNMALLPLAWETRLAHVDEKPPTTPTPRPNPGNVFGAGQDRPGDQWAAQTTWRSILEADGWTHAGTSREGHDEWTRPGKTVREGISATTGYGTHDVLKVFTTSAAPLQAEETYTKLGYLATVHHHGDHSAAADALRTLGYGTPPTSPTTPPAAIYEAADPDDEWPTTIPLGDNHRPPFPVDALPAWIAAQVTQAAEEMQLTPDLAAQLAVTALSIVTAGRLEVKVNGRHHEPVNTYTVTALPPSAGKSPTFRMMLGALDAWEARLVDESAAAIDERNIDRQVREKDRDAAIKQGETARAKELADELRDLPPLHTPRLMADDATPEKLVELLAAHNGRLGLVSTEGGLFGMMTGRYSDKANLDVYLGAWSGDTIRVDRIERGSTIVRDPALTIGLTVQPDVIARIGKDRELVGRGLTARFMYAVPADTVGRRNKRRESTYDDTVEARYRDELIGLADYLHNDDGTIVRLELSPDARTRYLDWTATREEQLGPHSPLRYMAEWVAKCDSTVARLAGLLHAAHDPTQPVINLDTVEAAIAVGDYWTAHARAAFDLMGASDDLGHARYLLDWLEQRDNNAGTVTFRDLHQHAKRRVEKAADLVPAVDILVDYGWLRPAFNGRIYDHIGRGKTSPTFHINPTLTRPHSSHLSHIDAETGEIAPSQRYVRDVRTVSPNTPQKQFHPENADSDQDPPKPRLTALTSDTDPDDVPVDDLDLGAFG